MLELDINSINFSLTVVINKQVENKLLPQCERFN